ncbi:MAG: hypothetical protein Q8R15_04240, partial [Candidatus Micrarchaeota archaeon]|nr:hypothetical protein [Candidatus Micrarchaeota archaeon]
EGLEIDGQTREDALQLSTTRDQIVLTSEELEKIKADVKADVIKDIMTLLGLNSGQLKDAAEKQKVQVENLKSARASMEEICEKVTDESKAKCDAQLAKMDADIKNLDDEATSFESRAGGIFGVLGGIAGGN